MSKKKEVHIEILRILAVFFVIFNHTGNKGFFLFSLYDSHGIRYCIYLMISVFCKFSVPLFLSISGALMLQRPPESLKKLWRNRIFRMIKVLLFWSIVYYIYFVCVGKESFSIKLFLIRIYDGCVIIPFWYLYAYIALLISLPILQNIAQSLTNNNYYYMFAIVVFFSMILPSAQYLLWYDRHSLNDSLRIGWLCTSIFIFPLCGYFLQHRINNLWNLKRIAILWFVNLSTILLSCYLTYIRAKETGVCNEAESQMFHSTFVLVNCVTVYVTIQYLCNHLSISEKIYKAVIVIGESTFGIYLIHVLVKNYSGLSMYLDGILGIHMKFLPMTYQLIVCMITLIISCIIVLFIKKIPFLRKFV